MLSLSRGVLLSDEKDLVNRTDVITSQTGVVAIKMLGRLRQEDC